MEKSQTNATNVTMHLLRQAIWGHIWKHTVEKNQVNATNVTLPLLRQSIWGHIWNRWNKYKRLHFWRCENYLSGGPTFLAPSNLCLQEVSTHYLHRHNHRQRTSDRGQNTFADAAVLVLLAVSKIYIIMKTIVSSSVFYVLQKINMIKFKVS